MEQYKKNLKLQNIISAVVALVCIAVIALGASGIVRPAYKDEHWASFWNGLYSGMAMGFCAMSILGIILNTIALHNEKKLKKQYIKEHDERTQAIWEKVGGQSYWFIAGGMMIAIVVSGYFNPLIALTCLGCLLYFCLVRGALKIYYSKKI